MGFRFDQRSEIVADFPAINIAHRRAEKWGLGNFVAPPVGSVAMNAAYDAVALEVNNNTRFEELNSALVCTKGLVRDNSSNGHGGKSKTDRFTPPKPDIAHPVRDALEKEREVFAAQLRNALDYNLWLQSQNFDNTNKAGAVQRRWEEHVDRAWDAIHTSGAAAVEELKHEVLHQQSWAKHFGVKQTGLTKDQAEADLKRDSRLRKHGRAKPAPKYPKNAQ